MMAEPERFPARFAQLRVALAHDWLNGMRGGEKVLELLCAAFPQAPIYTLIYDPRRISERINAHPVRVSALRYFPGVMQYYRYYLPFFPWAAERFRLPATDLLISTSHCVAKGVRPPPGAKHLCYCFTPMRYAWGFYGEYFGSNPIKQAILRPILARLREWDRRASARVDRFVAISRHVQSRIREFYGRESDLVYPPVATDYYTLGEPGHAGFDLVVSALVPYKRVDLAVAAYNQLGYPLKIVGAGTEFARLRAAAQSHIEFLGWQTDEQIRQLYRSCRCLVFPGEEDFGIVPVEAQACGKPVVAFGRGGALESILDGKTGIFFHSQTVTDLLGAVESCASQSWDPEMIRNNALRFGPDVFVSGLFKSIFAIISK